MSEVSNPTPTIEQLLAIEACREASRRYSYGVDRLDVEVMKSAYWPDGTDDHGVFVGNAWEFCDRVVGSHDAWEWTMHTTSNHRVQIDPDAKRRQRRGADRRVSVPPRRASAVDVLRPLPRHATSAVTTSGGSCTVCACTTARPPKRSRMP